MKIKIHRVAGIWQAIATTPQGTQSAASPQLEFVVSWVAGLLE